MTARKLSESDKQQILELYRLPGETTSTLATRYGVSNSTVSRILKTSLSEAEYEALIHQKRSARFANEPPAEAAIEEVAEGGVENLTEPGPEPIGEPPIEVPVAQMLEEQLEMPLQPGKPAAPILRRARKPASGEAEEPTAAESPSLELAEIRSREMPIPVKRDLSPVPAAPLAEEYATDAEVLKELLHEQLLDGRVEDLEEDDLDEEEEDLDDLDDEFDESDGDLAASVSLLGGRGAGKLQVQVLPIADAPIPKTCYLVVDRSSELIARPLKEFGDLGQIPEAEVLEKTLPVFDNHRVAKRFSNPRTQRVIKLPDGKVLQKTSSHLHAKGITRLLIDGQVYALQP
jgi:transposase-like protein